VGESSVRARRKLEKEGYKVAGGGRLMRLLVGISKGEVDPKAGGAPDPGEGDRA